MLYTGDDDDDEMIKRGRLSYLRTSCGNPFFGKRRLKASPEQFLVERVKRFYTSKYVENNTVDTELAALLPSPMNIPFDELPRPTEDMTQLKKDLFRVDTAT